MLVCHIPLPSNPFSVILNRAFLVDVNFDPVKVARDARKERVAKNEKQQLQNVKRAQGTSSNTLEERKKQIERTVATTRISTASMGRFDKRLEGEKKLKGVKRKVCTRLIPSLVVFLNNIFQFDPAEAPADAERNASLALLNKMESDAKKTRREPDAQDNVLNVRKAVRFASKGRGALALAKDSRSKSRNAKGSRKSR